MPAPTVSAKTPAAAADTPLYRPVGEAAFINRCNNQNSAARASDKKLSPMLKTAQTKSMMSKNQLSKQMMPATRSGFLERHARRVIQLIIGQAEKCLQDLSCSPMRLIKAPRLFWR